MLMAHFSRAGETRPMHYDQAAFTLLLDGEDCSFWIGNLFVEFQRTTTKQRKAFLSKAWEVWCIVQDDLPSPPKWVPEILRPFRDETHPLSYCVEDIPDTDLWTVAPPFDEPGGEGFDLVALTMSGGVTNFSGLA